MKSLRIDIVAPGSSTDIQVIESAIQILKEKGFQVHCPQNLIRPHLYLANSDENRFSFLKQALENSETDVIWSVRGGYGSNRLLPFLKKMKKPKKEKLFVGLSDVTSIHSFLNDTWGWRSLHATLLDRIGRQQGSKKDLKQLLALIRGEAQQVSYKIKPLNDFAKKKNSIKAFIRGGNLVTFQSLLGTPFQPDLSGQILVLEELSERAYRIDRIIQHLSQSGVLGGVKAVVFGQFLDCEEKDGQVLWPKTLKEWAEKQEFPVFHGLQVGHALNQQPLFLNTASEIKNGVLHNMSGEL